jgi:signal transduction histidine kinase
VIEFTDTGRGISVREAEKIFQPYFTTKSGGTGLGLAIVQGILQTMNGTIAVRSVPGKGTTFTITLPVYSQET